MVQRTSKTQQRLRAEDGRSYPLYQANGWFVSVVADDEVDLADVKSFLGDTGGHQRVVIAVTEGFDDAQLIGLSEAFAAAAFAACALTNEAHGFH